MTVKQRSGIRRGLKAPGGRGIIDALGALGALNDENDPDQKLRDAHAEMYYETLRNSKVEPIVKRLSKNGGISLKAARKVYQHVFINEHDLDDGVHRFPPSFDMAQSFQRILSGKNIQSHDLILLRHEWLEHGLMRRYGYAYQKAHDITDRKYNYALAANRWNKRRVK